MQRLSLPKVEANSTFRNYCCNLSCNIFSHYAVCYTMQCSVQLVSQHFFALRGVLHDAMLRATCLATFFRITRCVTRCKAPCNLCRNDVSFPRVSFLCLKVAHEKTHEYGYNRNKESYSLGNGTWSEMGKHCHVTEKVYCRALMRKCKCSNLLFPIHNPDSTIRFSLRTVPV